MDVVIRATQEAKAEFMGYKWAHVAKSMNKRVYF
jgi:hypothetical protein